MKLKRVLTLAVLALQPAFVFGIGSVYVTGHDADWHAQEGGSGALGAQHINQAAMNYVWANGANSYYSAHGIHKFLYVGDDGYQGLDSQPGSPGVTLSGYSLGTDFDVATSANIATLLPGLGTVYSGLWVASSSSELSQGLLDTLIANKLFIAHFVNTGGGIYAGAEGQYGISANPYGYIPGINSAVAFGQGEGTITVTAFGSGLGLTNSDVNANFSHNIFLKPDGLNIVDTDGAGDIISLAGRGTFGDTTITGTPAPGAAVTMMVGVIGGYLRRRQK